MNFKAKIKIAQNHLEKNDPILGSVIKKYGDCTIKPHKDYYGELVSSIVSQQLSTKAASTIWQRVIDLFNGQVPSPQQLLIADNDKIRACGVSYQKINYMKDLAQHIIDGRLDMAHIATLPNSELSQQLTSVKGIGQWSADMFMIFSVGRLDILPVGDLGIKKGIMHLYNLKALPDALVMQKIAKKNGWSPYESVASWYIWKSLANK